MKPTDEQLAHALKTAENAILNDSDSDHLALCITHLHRRNVALEEVFTHLERFLQFGMPTEEHTKLLILVQQLRERETSASGDTELDYGL